MTDNDPLIAFEACTLPFAEWTHRAHVRVAYVYLQRHPFDDAVSRLRTGIQRYNAHNKVPESPTSGYNETTTRAFAQLIAAVSRAYEKTHAVATADEFCDTHPQLMTRHVLRLFYSPERRMHPMRSISLSRRISRRCRQY